MVLGGGGGEVVWLWQSLSWGVSSLAEGFLLGSAAVPGDVGV